MVVQSDVGASTPCSARRDSPAQRWLNDPDRAIWCVIAVAFWKCLGLNLLLFLTALADLPKELAEAARIDGAATLPADDALHRLPLISPTIFFAASRRCSIVLDEIVGAVDVLTEGGPFRLLDNLLYYLYERGFRQLPVRRRGAVAVVIVAIVALAPGRSSASFERHVHYR